MGRNRRLHFKKWEWIHLYLSKLCTYINLLAHVHTRTHTHRYKFLKRKANMHVRIRQLQVQTSVLTH